MLASGPNFGFQAQGHYYCLFSTLILRWGLILRFARQSHQLVQHLYRSGPKMLPKRNETELHIIEHQ